MNVMTNFHADRLAKSVENLRECSTRLPEAFTSNLNALHRTHDHLLAIKRIQDYSINVLSTLNRHWSD